MNGVDMTFHASAPKSRASRRGSIVSRRAPKVSAIGIEAPARAFSRHMLLAGVSAITLSLLALQGIDAAAARPLGRGAGVTAAPTVAIDAATAEAQRATAIAKQSQGTLLRATQAIQAMQAAQAAARAAAASATNSSIADGLSIGGNGKLPGLVVDPRVATTPGLWINAGLPTQSASDGKTTVTIKQTAAQAVMTWAYYNVSPDTTVVYDQQGNPSWVALNRIDATGAPSQIRGQIKADGTVLLINPNGIIFGAGAQINVHSLIASSLDIDGTTAASAFNGVAAYNKMTLHVDGLGDVDAYAPPNEVAANGNFVGSDAGQGLFPIATALGTTIGNSTRFSMGTIDGKTIAAAGGGGITVEKGAFIETSVNSTGDGGYVALLGPNVTNSGSITTKNGQIILAAEGSVLLSAPQPTATGVHTAIAVDQQFFGGTNPTNRTFTASYQGVAKNDGLLMAPSGAVSITGGAIQQLGVLAATTSVTRPGSITFFASGNIAFGPDSVTAILPDEESGAVPAGTATADYFANSLQPQITIGGAGVDFQSGSLLRAPSAAVALSGSDVLLESGATIDVSGLADVQVPISNFLVTFVVTPNEIADSPLAAALVGKSLTIDTRLSGTRSDGIAWIGSPIVDASGYARLIPKSIEEILTIGGSVDVSGTNFIQQPGSIVDVSGGYVTYTGSVVNTTRLVGANGRFYDIGGADPAIRYVGVAAGSGFTVDHPRWGVTETYINPLLNRAYYEPSYLAGASAGSLSIAAAPILEGAILGETVTGLRQRANAQGGGTVIQRSLAQLPAGASLTITSANSFVSSYLLEASADAGDDPYGLSSYSYGTNWRAPSTVPVLTDRLSETGFASITIQGSGSVQPTVNMATGAVLQVAPGGSVTLTNVESIDGSIIAPAGKITLTGHVYISSDVTPRSIPADVVIGSNALLDVHGLWINDAGAVGERLQGSAFIDGGSISITTLGASVHRVVRDGDNVDATQSIILSPGSVIDVSSGGYVGVNGKLKLGSDGLPVGKGGNLSLVSYSGVWSNLSDYDPYNERPTNGSLPNTATVVLGGTIYSNGFDTGGTFTLQAPTITIDGQASAITSYMSGERSGEIVLPASFFTDNGFSNYSLTSVYGSSTVTAGTTVLLRQANYLASDGALLSLPTGASLRNVATIGLAPDGLRNPVSFTLQEYGYIYGGTGPSTTAGTLLDAGARIIGEANASRQATVTLAAAGPVTVLGEIIAPGGDIALANTGIPFGTSGPTQTVAPRRITIGSDAVLDVSGVFIADPTQTAYRTGVALDAGTITLYGYSVTAQTGSRFLLDGTSAHVEIPSGAGLLGPRVVTQKLWSDGGVLQIGVNQTSSLYFAGSVSAHGGADPANGGLFRIGIPAASAPSILTSRVVNGYAGLPNTIVVEPAGVVGASLASNTALQGNAFVGVDTLTGGGFDSIELNAGQTVAFVGSQSIHLRGSLVLGGNLTLLPDGGGDPSTYRASSIGATTVDLSAGYVWLGQVGDGFTPPSASTSDGSITISAKWIDIGNPSFGAPDPSLGATVNFRNVGSVTLDSGDAIRLMGYNRPPTGNSFVGSLGVVGDLTLKAAEIYPTSGTSFTLKASGTITIEQAGVASQPLSAGGRIIVDANNIVQNGALWAPFGEIVLGNTATTQSVTLGAGSLTSVSGAGMVVPYGYTVDGERWFVGETEYNGSDYTGFSLTSSPTKAITLNGANVVTSSAARLDLSGGGDFYASEFVAGTGGSRNVLAGSSVYALVPSSSAKVAPYDPTFAYAPQIASQNATVFASSLLNAPAGTAIYIAGGNGIAAGYYTLMPGMYATLPGAYRVAVASTSVKSAAAQSYASMDGSLYVTGNFANVVSGTRSSQTVLFQLQPRSTWSRYSQIDIISGARFIRDRALTAGTAIPALPVDGGALTFAARNSLSLDPGSLFGFAAGSSPLASDVAGVGGQLAISAAKVLVLATGGSAAPAGTSDYLKLYADQLDDVGATNLLIGGSSVVDSSGNLVVTGVATDVEIATDAAHPLSAPQLLLVTRAGGGGVRVDDGGAIAAVGTVPTGADRAILVAGDGSLLRASTGAMVSVTRANATAQNGSILVGTAAGTATLVDADAARGVTIDGVAALTLDSSGVNRVGAAVLLARAYDLSAKVIDFGADSSSAGLALTDAILANFAGADQLRLRSASAFNFQDVGGLSIGDVAHPFGELTFDGGGFYSAGGETSVYASSIMLTNTRSSSSTTNGIAGSGGKLTFVASKTITQSAGTIAANGFGTITLQAGEAIRYAGQGSLTASNGSGFADVVLTAPNVIAAAGSAQALTASGVLTILSAGAAASIDAKEIGGALSFTAASILGKGVITAQAGSLSLTATNGDVTLADGARVNATGSRIVLGDVTEYAPGGTVRLVSRTGNVTIASGAKVDVSAAKKADGSSGNGYAGALYIATAYDGTTTLQGTLDGSAAYKDSGGTFVLSTGRIAGDLPWGGFTRRFGVAIYEPGDLTVPTGVTLNSTEVLLVSNQGSVIVDGTIDASGSTGGSIALYGAGVSDANGVTTGGVSVNVGARLLSKYEAPDKNDPGYANGEAALVANGGTITLGTTGYWDGVALNDDGSEKVTSDGSSKIVVASGAVIDVSAGADGVGGTVSIRAPVTTDASGARNVSVSFYKGASDSVVGASSVALNAYEIWSASDPTTAGLAKHFDGIIDPAGWYLADGTKIAGTTNSTTGIFTPSVAVNGNHKDFYQTTLLGFVNDPFGGADSTVAANFGSGVSNLRLRPEIDLYNPSSTVNSGNITVASNWNFGAGSIDSSGDINLLYRTTNGGEPGTLVLRAADNVKINATITDGFFVDYSVGRAAASAAAQYASETASGLYQSYLSMFGADGKLQYRSSGIDDYLTLVGMSWASLGLSAPPVTTSASRSFFGSMTQGVFDSLQFQIQAPATFASGASTEIIDQYNQYYAQYLNLFRAYETEIVALNTSAKIGFGAFSATGPGILSYADYLAYVTKINRSTPFFNPVANSLSAFTIPAAPTTNEVYYNFGGVSTAGFTYNDFSRGLVRTTATDYANRWTAYFFNIVNANLVNSQNPRIRLVLGSDVVPTLANVAGLDASTGVYAAVAVTPPYAPPAYTSLQSGYSSSLVPNPPVPADTIANNPAVYSVGNVAWANTTSAASLMSASLGNSFSYDFVAGAEFFSASRPSVDPNASISLATDVDPKAPVASIVIDGHTTYRHTYAPSSGTPTRTIYIPTMVRTGTGSITLTAAGNVEFVDPIVQGAVYTAGVATTTPDDYRAPTFKDFYRAIPSGLLSMPKWATGGGSIIVEAKGSIIGVDATTLRETWGDWLIHYGSSDGDSTPFSGCAAASSFACQTASWVNYASFFQNFGALGGGNATLRAVRNITDISASLPETMVVAGGVTAADPAHAIYYGGGNLLVQAGGDLNSGAFLVGRGAGRIDVGGSVQRTTDNPITSVRDAATYPLLLAAQDGYISVVAKGDLTLGTLLDPTTVMGGNVQNLTPATYLPGAYSGNRVTSYGVQAGLSLLSLTGDVNAMTLTVDNASAAQSGIIGSSALLPPSLEIAALAGDISVVNTRTILAYPTDGRGHDTASLTLAAAGSINVNLIVATPTAAVVGRDNDGGRTNPGLYFNPLGSSFLTPAPSEFTNSDTVLVSAGANLDGSLIVERPAQILVGRDIGDRQFRFTGLNFTEADVTSVVAGRDISGLYYLYGPGALLIEAGRNIRKPLGSDTFAFFGVNTGGNGSGGGNTAQGQIATLKSFLPEEGADITMLYGVAKGVDYAAAISAYVDPASAGANGIDFLSFIAASLGQSRDQAWTTFQTLDATRQHLLVDKAFLQFLTQVVTDYRNSSSDYYGKYGRAYEAIGTLFPKGLGYANDRSVGSDLSAIGRLVMPFSLVETQMGGDINIIGPNGGIRVGSAGRDTLAPNREGILTLRGGSIRIYTDQTVLVNQSRIMTQQGGNVEIFSGNGDIDAGSGPKTYASNPVLSEVCVYLTGYCSVNPQGLVTGAGIGAIVTLPTQDPSLSNVFLSAPHGTVDLGAAGVRAAGNLTIIAQRVTNTYNALVGGTVSGLTAVTTGPNVGALTSASNQAGAASKAVNTPQAGAGGSDAPSIITVEVLGYGGSDRADNPADAATVTPTSAGEGSPETPSSNASGSDSDRRRPRR